MLPCLGQLSLVPTGAMDDVVTEILDEQQDAIEERLRKRYAAERQAARLNVFDNVDLVKEVIVALDQGNSWDACMLVTRWCSLNKSRRAACKDRLWRELVVRIWGKEAIQTRQWHWSPEKLFKWFCVIERNFRRSKEWGLKRLSKTNKYYHYYYDVKRFVLAAISKGTYRLLSLASERLRDDAEVVRAAIARDPRAIRFASPRLQAALGNSFMKESEYWPIENPTDIERTWGDAVMRMLLYKPWRELDDMNPLVCCQYLGISAEYCDAHKTQLEDLMDRLMRHISSNSTAQGWYSDGSNSESDSKYNSNRNPKWPKIIEYGDSSDSD